MVVKGPYWVALAVLVVFAGFLLVGTIRGGLDTKRIMESIQTSNDNISAQIRMMAERNRADIAALVDSINTLVAQNADLMKRLASQQSSADITQSENITQSKVKP